LQTKEKEKRQKEKEKRTTRQKKKKKKKKHSRWSLHYSLLCVSRECQGKIKDKIPKKQINITL
jgi:hypothetical protein